jgi:predicted dienelactone hydrolase
MNDGFMSGMQTFIACAVIALTSVGILTAQSTSYDPLKVKEGAIISKTFEVKDVSRDRVVPVRIYLPETDGPAPVILFSHGLGGSRDNNPYLGNHWAKRGYVVVFVQHPGSDESVWKGIPQDRRTAAMKDAASAKNLILRVKDIPAVIDTLMIWNSAEGNPMKGRLDLKHIGMSGHSFGAITTQAVAGQTLHGGAMAFTESRLTAAVMFSPSPPKSGDPGVAFEPIKIPCLLMTGTLDSSPIGDVGAEDRLKVFTYLKHAPAWQVVFDKANHMSFSDRDLKGKSENDNRYHTPILALTTAFWDAGLKGDPAARSWLSGDGARSVLASEDKWEINERAIEKR